MDQRGYQSRPYISLLKNVSDTIKTMYKYIFKYSEDLSCCWMRHELFTHSAWLGFVLAVEAEKPTIVLLPPLPKTSMETPRMSGTSLINPSPFRAQNSFVIEPGEIICVVFNKNNKLFPQLFQPPDHAIVDYPGPQECLLLSNSSYDCDICIQKNDPLLLLLKHAWIKEDIKVVHIFPS